MKFIASFIERIRKRFRRQNQFRIYKKCSGRWILAIEADRDSLKPTLKILAQREWVCKTKWLSAIYFDLGGGCLVDEPGIEFKANGVRFRTRIRHLPQLCQRLSEQPELADNPGHIGYQGGMFYQCIISLKTRDALLSVLETLVQIYSSEIEHLQNAIVKGLDKIPMMMHGGCCFCGSSKKYTECCGTKTKEN